MSLPRTLTSRLVLTATGLVAVVSVLVAGMSILGLRSVLLDELDRDVRGFAMGPQSVQDRAGLVLIYGDDGTVLRATYRTPRGNQPDIPLTAEQVDELTEIPSDGKVRSIRLEGIGSMRVRSTTNVRVVGAAGRFTLVNGLSTTQVDATLATLVRWEALFGALGVLGAFGLSSWLVRRNLTPLREVAAVAQEVTALPLDRGSVGLTARVPERLTDTTTEVGRVGASLNSLLGHVESALEARHQSEQQVRQFVADASHELRTPLTTIRGYAELANRNPAELGPAMLKVSDASGRMTALVEDLLLLARLDSGRPLESSPVDLSVLVAQAVEDIEVVAPDHDWALSFTEDDAVIVPGDEQRLHQVVTNLLNNARRHTPAGTHVAIGLSVAEAQAVLTVHDDGPGIPPGVEVFERFSRGDSSRTRVDGDGGGAGLGLSLVAAITAAHGGRVSVRSLPGDTLFTVRLPLHAAPGAAGGVVSGPTDVLPGGATVAEPGSQAAPQPATESGPETQPQV